MRLYELLVLVAFLIGLAQCCVFNVVIPPATTAINQPEATAIPPQLATRSDEQPGLSSSDEPSHTMRRMAQPESTQMERRDVPQTLDYRCGPKWGKCPGGTCCSSAGESLIELARVVPY